MDSGKCNSTLVSMVAILTNADYSFTWGYLLIEIIIASVMSLYRWRILKTQLLVVDEFNMGRRRINSLLLACALGLTATRNQDITHFYGQAGKSLTITLARSLALLICTPLWLLFRRRGFTAGNYIFARFESRSWSVLYCLISFIYLIHCSTSTTSAYISAMKTLGYDHRWANAAAFLYASTVYAMGGMRCICYLAFIRLVAIFWSQLVYIIESINRFSRGQITSALTAAQNRSFWYVEYPSSSENSWYWMIQTPLMFIYDLTDFGATHIGLSYFMCARHARDSLRCLIVSIIIYGSVALLNDISSNLVYLYYDQNVGCDPVSEDRIPPFSMLRLYFLHFSNKAQKVPGYLLFMAAPNILQGSFQHFSIIISIWLQSQADILLPMTMHDIVEVNPYRFPSILSIGVLVASYISFPDSLTRGTINFLNFFSSTALTMTIFLLIIGSLFPQLPTISMWMILLAFIPTCLVYFLNYTVVDPRNQLFIYSAQFVTDHRNCKLMWYLNRTEPFLLLVLFGEMIITVIVCLILSRVIKRSKYSFEEKLFMPIAIRYWKDYYKHMLREMKQKKLGLEKLQKY